MVRKEFALKSYVMCLSGMGGLGSLEWVLNSHIDNYIYKALTQTEYIILVLK